jgi:hypothetical protein
VSAKEDELMPNLSELPQVEASDVNAAAEPSFAPASTWDGLEWVATPQWIEKFRAEKIKIGKYVNTVPSL